MTVNNDVIYIVGFPKSGNTWLTRLTADALGRQVQDRVMRDSPEIAADFNRLRPETAIAKGYVAKVHFLPHVFLREITPAPTRVIYVYRDIRDVLVSAYFYFSGAADDPPSLRGWWGGWGGRGSAQRAAWDQKFWTFGDRFLQKGVEGQEELFGNWADHVNVWSEFLTAHHDIRSCFVSYEGLSRAPVRTLGRAFEELGLELDSVDRLRSAVARQSFAALKERALKNGDEMLFGKAFHLRFLRRGRVGDWRRYLPRTSIQRFPPAAISTMKRLGYL